MALYVALPQQLLAAPRYVLPGLELLLLIPLFAINPKRLTREAGVSRLVSLTLVFIIAAGNLFALGMLLHDLLSVGVKDGRSLLVAALQVWLTIRPPQLRSPPGQASTSARSSGTSRTNARCSSMAKPAYVPR
ncbi:hypothetical protein [Streptomyces sp. NPDC054786]